MSSAAPTLPEGLVGRVHRRLAAETAGGDRLGLVGRLVDQEAPRLAPAGRARAIDAVVAATRGMGPLEPLLADPDVSEIMVNGDGRVWVERAGRLSPAGPVLAPETTELLIERVVAPLGLRVDRSSPTVDARLPDGSRVNAVVPPLAVDGPCLTIRRFGARQVELDEVCRPEVASLLRWAVAARFNLLVVGGTGAGKTTLLNALGRTIGTDERVVTVEDAAELRLGLDHVVRLEARPANAEGEGRVDVRALVRNALRMRPDRIVVGECRGPEALDMLQAMNTGHDGSLSTCHANGTADALRRLETMVLMADAGLPLAAVRDQVAAALDLVVHVARRPDGSRAVAEVAEVVEAGDVPDPDGGSGGGRVRHLAGSQGVEALPRRAPRWAAAPCPDPAWLHGGRPC